MFAMFVLDYDNFSLGTAIVIINYYLRERLHAAFASRKRRLYNVAITSGEYNKFCFLSEHWKFKAPNQ